MNKSFEIVDDNDGYIEDWSFPSYKMNDKFNTSITGSSSTDESQGRESLFRETRESGSRYLVDDRMKHVIQLINVNIGIYNKNCHKFLKWTHEIEKQLLMIKGNVVNIMREMCKIGLKDNSRTRDLLQNTFHSYTKKLRDRILEIWQLCQSVESQLRYHSHILKRIRVLVENPYLFFDAIEDYEDIVSNNDSNKSISNFIIFRHEIELHKSISDFLERVNTRNFFFNCFANG